MKTFKALALLLFSLSAGACVHADYYRGNTVKPHGHTSNTDGGVISNLNVTSNVTFPGLTAISAYGGNGGDYSVTTSNTDIPWTETIDRIGEFSLSTFTATTTGTYLVTAMLTVRCTAVTAATDFTFAVFPVVNDGAVAVDGGAYLHMPAKAGVERTSFPFMKMISLTAGDRFKLQIREGGGFCTSPLLQQTSTLSIQRVP